MSHLRVIRKVHEKRDVVQEATNKIDRYRTQWGQSPLGLVCGPNEYAALCGYVCRLSGVREHLTTFIFMGVEVLMKEGRGIDLLAPLEFASRMMLGTVERAEKYDQESGNETEGEGPRGPPDAS